MNKKNIFIYSLLLFLGAYGIQQKSYAQGIPAPTLHCVDVDENGGNRIDLEWESNANCGLGNSQFEIWVSAVEGGVYDPVDTVDGSITTYTHNNPPSTPTNDNPLFYSIIEVCGGVRSDLQEAIVGTNQPITPDIDFVRVVNDSLVEIIWTPTNTINAAGYAISRSSTSGAGLILVGAVSGTTTNYIDTLPPGTEHPIDYFIVAFNRCDNPNSTQNAGSPTHSTMGISVLAEGCDAEAIVTWTSYGGWEADKTSYVVQFLEENDDNNVTNLDTLLGTEPTNYTYIIPSNFSSGSFRIEAIHTLPSIGGQALFERTYSNTVPLDVEAATGPAYVCVTNATVNENGFIDLTWQIDATQPRNSLMYRSWSDTQTENPQRFTLISDAQPTTPEMTIQEESVNTNGASYTYRVVHNDECNRETASGTVTTMLLRAEDAFNFTNRLIWNPFEITNGTIQAYRIHRKAVDEATFEQIAEVNPLAGDETIIYEDSNLGEITRQYCYKIEAVYTINCIEANFVETLSSFSNETCVNQASRIIVPNAFTPNDAVNNIFKPTIVFPNADSYQMLIANRWGENVYMTTNPDDGWDGLLRDELAPQGVYLYYITMTTVNGFNIERKGSVLLIR